MDIVLNYIKKTHFLFCLDIVLLYSIKSPIFVITIKYITMKNNYIRIRINNDVKAKFQELCEMQGKGMSKVLQSMIDFELKKSTQLQ